MKISNKKTVTIYYGPAITDRIYNERSLPLRNAPTTQRMSRIAAAVRKSGDNCIILSPAVMPRIRSSWRIWPIIISKHGGIPIIALKQLSVRYLGYILAPLFAINAAKKISEKRNVQRVIQYNFNPDAFAFGLWCKIRYKSELILEIEDVSKIKVSDWLPYSGVRALNQWYTYILQRLSIIFCDSIIVPSRKFLPSLPRKKPVLVIGGCQNVEKIADEAVRHESRILLSGSLTLQNGVGVFFDALEILSLKTTHSKLSFIVCGIGMSNYVQERLRMIHKIEVAFLGTLSNAEFAQIYKNVDMCLVLQDPNGRFGESKSPSKGYEALCSGKTIIVTDIGDFGGLPSSICYHLRNWSAQELAEILEGLTVDDVLKKGADALKYAKCNYDIEKVGARLRDFYISKA